MFFYLGSPVTRDSPPLSGGLILTPIDRTGFAEALPEVPASWGFSAYCFSANVNAPLIPLGEFSAN